MISVDKIKQDQLIKSDFHRKVKYRSLHHIGASNRDGRSQVNAFRKEVNLAKKTMIAAIGIIFLMSAAPVMADEFSISFEWGDIPLCTSGNPNIVKNPRFILSNVPENTKIISFSLEDLDAPNYNHGGGKIVYTGNNVIEPGAFTYKSPCPPSGSHRYVWTATAKEKDSFLGCSIGKAKSMKRYPEK